MSKSEFMVFLTILKDERYSHISKVYDSKAHWANVCYKSQRFFIDRKMTITEALAIIDKL